MSTRRFLRHNLHRFPLRITPRLLFILPLLIVALGGGLAQAQDPTATNTPEKPGQGIEAWVTDVTATSISLDWTPRPRQYGLDVGYEVRYKPKGPGENYQYLYVLETEATLTGLQANTDYEIGIRNYLIVNEDNDKHLPTGITRRELTARTSGGTPTPTPEKPGQAIEAWVTDVTATSISLDWTPRPRQYGLDVGYEVRYKPKGPGENYQYLYVLETEATLTGLQANTDYEIGIRNYLIVNEQLDYKHFPTGITRRELSARTSGSTPTPIPEVEPLTFFTVVENHPSFARPDLMYLTVTWDGPTHTGHYSLTINADGKKYLNLGSNGKLPVTLGLIYKTSITINQIVRSTGYDFKVTWHPGPKSPHPKKSITARWEPASKKTTIINPSKPTPTPTATSTPTLTPTPTVTSTPTITSTPTQTGTPKPFLDNMEVWISAATSNSITLDWTPLSGAHGYRINMGFGPYNYNDTTDTQFTWTNLDPGRLYTFLVTGYINSKEGYKVFGWRKRRINTSTNSNGEVPTPIPEVEPLTFLTASDALTRGASQGFADVKLDWDGPSHTGSYSVKVKPTGLADPGFARKYPKTYSGYFDTEYITLNVHSADSYEFTVTWHPGPHSPHPQKSRTVSFDTPKPTNTPTPTATNTSVGRAQRAAVDTATPTASATPTSTATPTATSTATITPTPLPTGGLPFASKNCCTTGSYWNGMMSPVLKARHGMSKIYGRLGKTRFGIIGAAAPTIPMAGLLSVLAALA